jgi:hypothetical protein
MFLIISKCFKFEYGATATSPASAQRLLSRAQVEVEVLECPTNEANPQEAENHMYFRGTT